jgi:MoaA/NifB/PqqE/SkfB family radical SAM enzyme
MDYPKIISLTLTNRCNLRCRMCGQWGQEGYLKGKTPELKEMPLDCWKNIIDQLEGRQINMVLLRGGEPLLYPGVIELIRYIKKKKYFVSMDSNGTMFSQFAGKLLDAGLDNITLSIDGPEEVHDYVRGVKGCYQQIKEGVKKIREIEKASDRDTIIRSICFVISPASLRGLSALPDTARELNIPEIAVVPYYYADDAAGMEYGIKMKKLFNIEASAWKGFHREKSGIDIPEFLFQFRELKKNLGNIKLVPFMPFEEGDFINWFSDCTSPAGAGRCRNPELLLDIQPDGKANFCIDFLDYSIGNAFETSIEELFNNSRAAAFRKALKKELLPVCRRCGAKYMTEFQD